MLDELTAAIVAANNLKFDLERLYRARTKARRTKAFAPQMLILTTLLEDCVTHEALAENL